MLTHAPSQRKWAFLGPKRARFDAGPLRAVAQLLWQVLGFSSGSLAPHLRECIAL